MTAVVNGGQIYTSYFGPNTAELSSEISRSISVENSLSVLISKILTKVSI
jgi:hypothetical protein